MTATPAQPETTLKQEADALVDAVAEWRSHINSMLDALASDPEQWLTEMRIDNAVDAVQEFIEGGYISDVVADQSLHMQLELRGVLYSVLVAIKRDLRDGGVNR